MRHLLKNDTPTNFVVIAPPVQTCNFEQGRTLKPHHDNTSRAGARYTIWIASLELRHEEHNDGPYPLQNNTINFTQ